MAPTLTGVGRSQTDSHSFKTYSEPQQKILLHLKTKAKVQKYYQLNVLKVLK